MPLALRAFTIVLSQRSALAEQNRKHVATTLRGEYAFAVGDPSQGPRYVFSPSSSLLSLCVPDDYSHLPLKVVRAFEWAFAERTFDVLVKIDDDTLFCPERMPRAFPSPLTYAGYFLPAKNRTPQVVGRWADPAYSRVFGRALYPKYAQGGGYVLTRELLGRVLDEVNRSLPEEVLETLRIEDAAIGTLVSRVRGAVYYSFPIRLFGQRAPVPTAPVCHAHSRILKHKVAWIEAAQRFRSDY